MLGKHLSATIFTSIVNFCQFLMSIIYWIYTKLRDHSLHSGHCTKIFHKDPTNEKLLPPGLSLCKFTPLLSLGPLCLKLLLTSVFGCIFEMEYYTAKNFRQRKISSKATVRQFVRYLFSSNVGSLVLSSVVRFACLLFIFTFMTISDPTVFVLWKI